MWLPEEDLLSLCLFYILGLLSSTSESQFKRKFSKCLWIVEENNSTREHWRDWRQSLLVVCRPLSQDSFFCYHGHIYAAFIFLIWQWTLLLWQWCFGTKIIIYWNFYYNGITKWFILLCIIIIKHTVNSYLRRYITLPFNI